MSSGARNWPWAIWTRRSVKPSPRRRRPRPAAVWPCRHRSRAPSHRDRARATIRSQRCSSSASIVVVPWKCAPCTSSGRYGSRNKRRARGRDAVEEDLRRSPADGEQCGTARRGDERLAHGVVPEDLIVDERGSRPPRRRARRLVQRSQRAERSSSETAASWKARHAEVLEQLDARCDALSLLRHAQAARCRCACLCDEHAAQPRAGPRSVRHRGIEQNDAVRRDHILRDAGELQCAAIDPAVVMAVIREHDGTTAGSLIEPSRTAELLSSDISVLAHEPP